MIPSPSPFRGRGKLVLGRKTKLGPVRPCVRLWGPGRERHQRSTRQALLDQRDPVVEEQSTPQQTQDRRSLAPPPLGGGVCSFWGENPNSPLCGPVCDFEARVGKRHQKNGFPALLGPCGADVDEFRDSGKPG